MLKVLITFIEDVTGLLGIETHGEEMLKEIWNTLVAFIVNLSQTGARKK
jgi:hypothetical protein